MLRIWNNNSLGSMRGRVFQNQVVGLHRSVLLLWYNRLDMDMQSVNDIYKGKQACFGTVTRNHLLVIILG